MNPNTRLATVLQIFLSNGVILGCGLVTGILLARLLLPEQRGALAALILWPQLFCAVGLLSLPDTLMLRLGKGRWSGDRIIASSLWLAILLAGVTLAVALVSVPYLLVGEPDLVRRLMPWFLCVYIPSNYIALVLLSVDQSRRDFGWYSILRVAGPLLYMGTVVLLALTGAVSLLTAALASLFGNVIVALTLLARHHGSWLCWPRVSEVRALAWQSLGLHSPVLLGLIAAQMDRVVVAVGLDSTSLGYYSAAITVSGSLLGAIVTTSQSYLFPEVASATSSEVRAYWVLHGLKNTCAAICLSAVGLVLICPLALPLLFGNEYTPATLPAILSILAYVPFALRQVAIRCLRATGDVRWTNLSEGLTIATFAILLWLFGVHGLVTTCLTLLAANLVGLAACGVALTRMHQIRNLDWLVPSLQGLSGLRTLVQGGGRMAA
jgi:enterobacterial common antigen flippase